MKSKIHILCIKLLIINFIINYIYCKVNDESVVPKDHSMLIYNTLMNNDDMIKKMNEYEKNYNYIKDISNENIKKVDLNNLPITNKEKIFDPNINKVNTYKNNQIENQYKQLNKFLDNHKSFQNFDNYYKQYPNSNINSKENYKSNIYSYSINNHDQSNNYETSTIINQKKIPFYLNKSPIIVDKNIESNNINTNSLNTLNNINNSNNNYYYYKKEVNKNFSPYSSIHYLSTIPPTTQKNTWKWEPINKPILRTNTIKPVEFKHKIPNMNEAWWNTSYNVRRESQNPKNYKNYDNTVKITSDIKNNYNDQNNDEILAMNTIGDIVDISRLEIPNPYDRRVAIDNLISNSLSNMKEENWSIPVEELINATFIYPGTEQPELVPNQMGPKVKIQDFYCNPQIHKCTSLYAVGTSIGEPLWKIYNTSTIGRVQKRISNLLDDTEDYLTMGITPTFIDYIEQEPTVELLESIAKAPSNIFLIPENGSITNFYDNATHLGFFQNAEFLHPLPQNKTHQKFASALKKAAIDCLLSNFTLPNCNIPSNNTTDQYLFRNHSIFELFEDIKNHTLI